jgi:Ankyrin repeat
MDEWNYGEFRNAAIDENGCRLGEQTGLSEEQFMAVARDQDSRTLLHHLCRRHNEGNVAVELSDALAIGANPNSLDCDGRTPLHELCDSIYGVASFDELDAIDVLLRAGAQIDARDNRGNTPLMESLRFMCPEVDEDDEGRSSFLPSQDTCCCAAPA